MKYSMCVILCSLLLCFTLPLVWANDNNLPSREIMKNNDTPYIIIKKPKKSIRKRIVSLVCIPCDLVELGGEYVGMLNVVGRHL